MSNAASEIKKTNREHSFDFELAAIVGIEKAILLKNIDYWCHENRRRNHEQYFEHNMWWTEESLASLAKKYPYMKRSNIGRWMGELHSDGWIRLQQSAGSTSRYSTGKTFETWDTGGDWKSLLSQNETPNDRPKMRHQPSQNETPTVPNRDGKRPKMGHNNIDSNIEVDVETDVEVSDATASATGPVVKVLEVEAPVEDRKNGATSRGAGPQTKSWTHRASTIFDEVDKEQCETERIDYQPFNWKVCTEENFKQLKNLREKGIEPDYKSKYHVAPNDQQLDDCLRVIFTLAWKYFRKIQKEKGGSLHYTPTSIYTSYNRIKKFKGNINDSKSTDPERDIYRRNTFGQGIDDFGTNHS